MICFCQKTVEKVDLIELLTNTRHASLHKREGRVSDDMTDKTRVYLLPLPDGSVRFAFLVSAEELEIEETPDLLGGDWRPLPDDEVQVIRETNGNGKDRLTVILPQAEGKQRFLRLMPQC